MEEQRKVPTIRGRVLLERMAQIGVAAEQTQVCLDVVRSQLRDLHAEIAATRPVPEPAPPDPNRKPDPPRKSDAARALRGGTPGM